MRVEKKLRLHPQNIRMVITMDFELHPVRHVRRPQRRAIKNGDLHAQLAELLAGRGAFFWKREPETPRNYRRFA